MSEYNDLLDPFSVCFNVLKIKYKDYDELVSSANFLREHDKVNLFINLESPLKNLSLVQDLEKKLLLQREYEVIMVSNILNLAAHYKQFFVNNGLDTKVYIYMTDLLSDEFAQFRYNEDFRSYYLVKYNENPKFLYLSDALKGSILPDVKTYCEFIPNVYFINSHNIEGSLVPMIIANEDPTRKNLIISSDMYDSQYGLMDNFLSHIIHRNYSCNAVRYNAREYMKEFTKNIDDLDPLTNIYKNYSLYCSLLSVMGDKSRSVDGLNGVGIKSLKKLIDEGVSSNNIQLTTSNPMVLGSIFTDNKIREEFTNNFYCSCLTDMYNELTSADKMSIFNQRVDRFDNNSLMYLNSTKFSNHRLLLEALTC